jgi:putative ABC transport system permease protein
MLKNYLLIAFRNFFRNRTTSLVNFLGLTIGLASSFLIYINVHRELSYDRFHNKKDRIFRVLSIDNAIGVSNNLVGITIPALALAMKDEIPEVENVVRILGSGRSLVEYNQITLYSENLIYTEPSFLEVFDFRLMEGDPVTCLAEPNTALLTQTMAKKVFGDEYPIGKVFSADGSNNLVVTGILDDEKRASHIKFDIVISINPSASDSTTAAFLNSWNNIAMTEYALLRDPSKAPEVIAQMDTILRKNNVLEAWKATLQPLKEAHLYSSDILFDNFNQDKGNIKYVQSLSLVAIIILLIASFNYMNLSTARSAKRAREVGVRKTVGAFRAQLIGQHLSEAVMQTLLSTVIAIVIIELINHFYHISDSTIVEYLVANPMSLIYILLLVSILGLVSGIYPALVLSSYQPMVVLKGKFEAGKQGLWLRRFLVSIQFIAAFVMIIGTLVVVNQLNYTLNKDKGFNTEQIIILRLTSRKLFNKYGALKDELLKIPGIKMVSTSSSMPGFGFGRRGIIPEGFQGEDTWITSVFAVDENYIPLMNMKLVEGENFRADMAQQPVPVIVNQSLVKEAGWENGLNKRIKFRNNTEAIVIGVVEDFHFTSMRHRIEPIMISYQPGANGIISIKVDDSNISSTIGSIERAWRDVNGSIPFEYTFFDESFGKLFEKEKEFSKLFFRFTMLSIFVAILGLFGLATFSAEQKTKEIGIRKTFGATTVQMILLQLVEYTRLIALSIALGVPLSAYIMRDWLQSFEYRIDLDPLPFFYSTVIILSVTLITVIIQSFRAAQMNPTESLKYE